MSKYKCHLRGFTSSLGQINKKWFGLLIAVIVHGASCYLAKEPPPAFRFACEKDSQCTNIMDQAGQVIYTERCIDGLCQYPCTTSLLSDPSDCPPNHGFLCFNGVCSNLCDPGASSSSCSHPQACQELTIPDGIDPMQVANTDLGALTSGFGICGTACTPEDSATCPEGQTCFEGICLGPADLANLGNQNSQDETEGETS